MNEITQLIDKVLSPNYFPVLKASENQFNDMENDFLEIERLLKKKIPNPEIQIKNHTQTGRRASVPWIEFSIINNKFDSKPQTGVYLTLLFNADGSGLALSLQHGVDKIKGKNVRGQIHKTIKDLRTLIPNYPNFEKQKIDLKSYILNSPGRPSKYEISNLIGKEYKKGNLNNLYFDILSLLDIYIEFSKNTEDIYQFNDNSINKDDFDKNPPIKNQPKNNKQINRRPSPQIKQKEIAIQTSNYQCEVSTQHLTFTKNNGKKYIEAHHLIPMEYYFDFEKNIDFHRNIFALCPNCHKKIHLASDEEKKDLIVFLYKKREQDLKKHYNLNLESLFTLYNIKI